MAREKLEKVSNVFSFPVCLTGFILLPILFSFFHFYLTLSFPFLIFNFRFLQFFTIFLLFEQFLDRKVFLSIHVRVDEDWRASTDSLTRYGYVESDFG